MLRKIPRANCPTLISSQKKFEYAFGAKVKTRDTMTGFCLLTSPDINNDKKKN